MKSIIETEPVKEAEPFDETQWGLDHIHIVAFPSTEIGLCGERRNGRPLKSYPFEATCPICLALNSHA